MIKTMMELKHFFMKLSSIFEHDDFTITFTFPTEKKARIAAELFTLHVVNTLGMSYEPYSMRNGVTRKLAGVNIKFAWRERVVRFEGGEV